MRLSLLLDEPKRRRWLLAYAVPFRIGPLFSRRVAPCFTLKLGHATSHLARTTLLSLPLNHSHFSFSSNAHVLDSYR